MAPPRWIHCNLCFYVMVRKERKFYHLPCRHVLCRPCMAKTNRGTLCPVCQEPMGQFSELSNQMDRKDKMCYDPAALRALSITSQSVVFQHQQRERLIRGILRCRTALTQLREMENSLRQRIVATQRQYEKFRAYRRNLQDILRQNSSSFGKFLATTPGQPAVPTALPNRVRDRDSRSQGQRISPVVGMATPGYTTPTLSGGRSGFVHPVATNHYPQQSVRSNPTPAMLAPMQTTANKLPLAGEKFANDSGISGMRTPLSSREQHNHHHHHHIGSHQHLRQQLLRPTPTPAPTATRRPFPFFSYDQTPSTITNRR